MSKGDCSEINRLDVKNLIMKGTSDKFVWSNELFKLPKNRNPWKIRVCEHMTHFYSKIWFTAMEMKEKHRLHSFRLTKDGLAVKRTPSGGEFIVLSEQQLLEYVLGRIL